MTFDWVPTLLLNGMNQLVNKKEIITGCSYSCA